jgi:2-polyprenyl-3-methyl-5-hydroxy-6-metoxy-1,4-benzoquinol methylase
MKKFDADISRSISSNEFNWVDSKMPDSHAYLAPVVLSEIRKIAIKYPGKQLEVLDLGCGNGRFSARLANEGYQVNACDHSISGVEIAKIQLPHIGFFQQDINKELPEQYRGRFDIVISLEVIEHLFHPRALFDRAKEALGGQGSLIVSTPYHGYTKNLALALCNKFDMHWHPLKDFGHIKFFSKNTLLQCLRECGFFVNSFSRVGRISALAKSMIVVAELKE